jgi:ABC-type lipoprotein release transport system permease subunit
MGISGYFSSLTDAVATLNTRSSTHIAVRFAQGQQFEQVQQLIESQIPEVRRIHPGYSVNVDLEGYISTSGFTLGTNQIVAQGIDLENPPMRLELSAGRLTSAGAVISAGLASKLGVTLGDPLNMVIGENAATYPVVGIEDNGADALYFDWRTLADVARFRTWDQTPLVNSVFIELNAIELNAPNDAAAIDSQIDTLTRYLDSNGIMAVYTNQPEATEESIRLISLLGTVFNMASLVMGLVGAIGLFSALTMAVFERQREIGIMRSIGAGSGTIIVQFVVEGVVIGVLAWAVGVPLSVVLASGLDGILSALANNLEFAYPVGVVITGLIGMVVLSLTASVLPSVSASRKTVSDILRYA